MKPFTDPRQQWAAEITHRSLIILPPQSAAPPNSNRKKAIETIQGQAARPAVTPFIIFESPKNRPNWLTSHDLDAVKCGPPRSNRL